ncbi:MAG: Helicase PriA essential for oriC/DnaA-independent DNA replication [Nitrospira sp.]|nr:MAG: Helicase PriA essential for oriC/DnaA-independent DNA replication [Nitrospira sp.]
MTGVLRIFRLLECDMASDGTSTPLRRMEILYADVIVPRHIAKAFTYVVPPTLTHTIAIGHRVRVPFGRTVLEGVVISLSNHLATEIKSASIREIHSLDCEGEVSTLPPALFELSRKIAEYYVVPWGQCLRLILPSIATRKTSPARYVVTAEGRAALEAGLCPDHLKPTLGRIARKTSGIPFSTLQPARQETAVQIDALINKSWIARMPSNNANEQNHRTPGDGTLPTETLPEIDRSWKTHVAHCLHSNSMRKLVLHAPWEHRLSRLVDAIQQAHSMKRATIVLTGEIARASWLRQVLSRLTDLQIILARPPSESGRWQPNQGQTPSVVVGTRSAIFSPLKSIGLIWVEDEEDPALKEPQEPRYHAREVASLRAESERALVVLASAHPSLESRFDAEAEFHHVSQDVALQPTIELVDLRDEPPGSLFSHTLIRAMHEALQNHAKILLFLNRKGYARTLVCRDCGWVPRCDSCIVPLTYYREAGRLTCRYCGKADRLPDLCPLCHTPRINPIGDGTERVEAEVHRLFPQVTVARLDGDTLRHSRSAHTLWKGARSGSWDVLIGTQALFRREPLPRYGLVGILQADSGLHVSEFRAAERTYHLLVDAVSLACPASAGGRVIVQTRLPTHHAIQALISGDPDHFYNEEFAARRLLHYPPVCRLADLSVTGKDLRIVEEAAKRWGADLEQNVHDQEPLIVLGPVPAIRRHPKGHQQYRILVKGTALTAFSRRLHDSVQKMEREYRKGLIKFVIDIDPVENG